MSKSRVLTGALAGFAATVPMTAVMMFLHRFLPWWERYDLPPARITAVVSTKADQHPDRSEHIAITGLAHFGYGATMGGVYTLLTKTFKWPPVLKGTLFGLGVWVFSYLGLLPALNVLRPATEHPIHRTALMIIAHVVWGASLGPLADTLNHKD